MTKPSKPADTSQSIHPLIANRWSPRSFADKAVAPAELAALFEAARWAPSCNNSQPWRFIVATKDDAATWEAAQGCINERNQRWSRTAPVVGFVCAYTVMPNGNPSPTPAYDTGMAMAQLIIEAMARGLYVHQMAGISRDKVRETYGVPPDTDVVAGFALGFQGEAEALPEELPERETDARKRNGLDAMVFSGAFGTAAPFLR